MELWDLYTRDRLPTGETHQRGNPLPPERYHMVVHVVIFNTNGEMLIQQRQPFKEGWPNMWDVTVGGSAIAGDNSRTAAERETLEEIGLRIDLSREQPKLTIPFDCGFDDIYTLTMLTDGQFIPYHRAFLHLLFALRDSRGAHVSKLG